MWLERFVTQIVDGCSPRLRRQRRIGGIGGTDFAMTLDTGPAAADRASLGI
jgi:hypothetical protein